MLWVASGIAGGFIGRQPVTLSSPFSFSVSLHFSISRSPRLSILSGSFILFSSLSLSLSLSSFPSFPSLGIDLGFVAASRRIASSASFLSFDSEHREGMWLCPMGRPRHVSDHLWEKALHTGGPTPASNQSFPESSSRRLPRFLDHSSFLRLARLLASSLVRWIRLPLMPIPYRQPAPPYHWEAHPDPACLAEWKRRAVRRRAVRNLDGLVTRQR
jgi:hypothetical protein